MRKFECECGQSVSFEDQQCSSCQSTLGFLPDKLELSKLVIRADGLWLAAKDAAYLNKRVGLTPVKTYRLCANYFSASACNWAVDSQDGFDYCLSCRLNHLVPQLRSALNQRRWRDIEAAKRHLIYGLLKLGMPIVSRRQDPLHGLAFQFLESFSENSEFSVDSSESGLVLTGHFDGMITINIIEADADKREAMRLSMNEGYRTLVGHFRHEIAHYYWDLLVKDQADIDQFRQFFGDEQRDYVSAMEGYYRNGPSPQWPEFYISAYASSHPWEDFAESWAHYMHMADTLEVAADNGMIIGGQLYGAYIDSQQAFNALMDDWRVLSSSINSLNHSLGLPDAYPFSPGKQAISKLYFIHLLVQKWRRIPNAAAD